MHIEMKRRAPSRFRNPWQSTGRALLASLLLAFVVPLAAQEVAVEPGEEPTFDRQNDDVLRSAPAVVRLEPITAAGLDAATAASTLTLELFDKRSIDAVAEHVAYPVPGTLTWSGRIAGDEAARVILAVTGKRLDGWIYLSDVLYEIRSGAQGHVLAELDPASLSFEDCVAGIDEPGTGGEKDPTSPPDDGSVVDVLVGYSPQAASRGGHATLRNRIALGVEVGNDILRTSGIGTRLRLVYSGLIDLDEEDPIYSNSGLVLLDRLVDPEDGFYDDIHRLRDRSAGDLTVAVVDDLEPRLLGRAADVMEGSTNTAFESRAFAVVRRSAIAGITLVHELGHLMGSHHDRESFGIPPTTGAFTYSFAFRDPGGRFKTVMAAGGSLPGTPRAPQFSSPLLTFDGLPAGSADTDNARSIRGVREVVANFRQSSDACGGQLGVRFFCALCGPCGEAEGDCDSDADCAPGLRCVEDAGPDYGFGPRVDVCLPEAASCSLPLGHPDYCLDSACGPCGAGEGDCEPNAGQCLSGLVCAENVGPDYGFGPNVDVCEMPPSSQEITLSPSGDAFVAREHPNTNFGDRTALRIRYAGGDGRGYGRFSFLRFDVPSIPGDVLSATLRLRAQDVPIGEVGYYAVDLAPWSETAITWNNWGHPSQATFLGSRLDVVPFSWIELDVSAAIDPSGGVLTLGLAAGGSSDVGGQDFYSRESVHSPELVIRYE